jgi:hypothetical protein
VKNIQVDGSAADNGPVGVFAFVSSTTMTSAVGGTVILTFQRN